MLPDDILNLCLHVSCPSLHISSLSIDEDFKRVLFWHERWEVASSLVQHVQQRLLLLPLHSILHWQGRIAVLSYQAIGRIRKEGRSSSPANITEYFVNSQFVSGFHCLRWITIDHYHLMSLFIFDHLIHLCAESLTRPFTGTFGWRRVGRDTGKNLLCDSLCNGCDWEKKKSLIFLLWQENIRSSLVRWNLFHWKHF